MSKMSIKMSDDGVDLKYVEKQIKKYGVLTGSRA